MRDHLLTEEQQLKTLLYALGVLNPEEQTDLEDHLLQGCPVCESEVSAFGKVVDALCHAATPHAPPVSLRQQLLDHVQLDSAVSDQ